MFTYFSCTFTARKSRKSIVRAEFSTGSANNLFRIYTSNSVYIQT